MSSLADQIAKLTNPAPEILDPEADIYTETVAKVCDKGDLDDELLEQVRALKSSKVNLLDEIDKKYSGKRLKKADLKDYIGKVSDSEDSNEDDVSSIESSDGDTVKDVKSKTLEKSFDDYKGDLSEDDFLESSGQNSDLPDDNSNYEDNEGDSSDNEDEESEIEDTEDLNSTDDMVQNFSNIDVTSEIDKGKAVIAQQELWNRLCECRIKLQKLLVSVNKLPQFQTWNIFKQSSDSTYKDNVNKSYKSVRVLLNSLLDLQQGLLDIDTEFASFSEDKIDVDKESNDEEIQSDSGEDHIVAPKQEKLILGKRKLKEQEYDPFLAKRHKSLIPFRNSIIQKWDEKTRLSSGRMTQKSFTAFDQSALKQIEQILQDKNRLIKRTQLKRSIYNVLGKKEPSYVEDVSDDLKVQNANQLLKDYDEEIFDDDDFYRLLLKDVIESKSVGIDPVILSKQQEIQKIRSKIRRKVDTKASKGRKIRYNVHPKLVNFMAPVVTCHMSDFARDNLFNSVFLPPGSTVKTS